MASERSATQHSRCNRDVLGSRYRLAFTMSSQIFLGRCYEYLLRKLPKVKAECGRVLYADRGRLPHRGDHATEVWRGVLRLRCGSFGLLIKLQLVSRRIDPLSKVRFKLYGKSSRVKLRDRLHEQDHSRHGRRGRPWRLDAKSEV